MTYRPDIDGLRAVAVLSVIAFHLGFSQRIAGGFVGVDVFFVISGYLLTGILQAEVEAGRMLWALARASRWLRVSSLAVLAIISFVVCERMVQVDARQAFYLVHCRAWELLAGSLLALGALPHLRGRALSEVIGLLGLGLILLAVFGIRPGTPFPGYWALPPCVGALAIVHSGCHVRTFTARFLSLPPLRWIGLASYSLYLWHWPLIALHNARHESTTDQERLQILALSFVAATLSYRYVERPFRRRPYRLDARLTLRLAALGMGLVAVLAVAIPAAAARVKPRSALADAALAYLDYQPDVRAGTCFLSSGFDDAALFRKDLCLVAIIESFW